MLDSSRDVLAAAVARNTGLVLSLPSAGLLRHHKSRFIAPTVDGIWVESVPSELPLIAELIQTGRAAGLSFRSGPNRVMFASRLVREEASFPVNESTSVRGLLVSHPDPAQIKMIQRRNNYRVSILAETGLTARMWRMPATAHLRDTPVSTAEIAIELKDFSAGGLGVIVRPNSRGEISICIEDRLRVEITFGQIVLLMEGRMRAPNQAASTPEAMRTGIQFKALQDDLEGRKQLSRLNGIIGELQRDEIRRFNLGL